jgi:hypothetical protein
MDRARDLEIGNFGTEILEFVRPDGDTVAELRALLRVLPIARSPRDVPPLIGAGALCGDLDSVLFQLAQRLNLDYSDNVSDTTLNADYCVVHDDRSPHVLSIHTRLFYPGHGSNVFFGYRVERCGEDDYVLWTDRYAPLLS